MIRPLNPNARRNFRLASFFLLGLIVIIWLPIEDLSERWAILIALTLCIMAAVRILLPYPPKSSRRWLIYSLVSGLAGLAVTPLALFLMAFKSGVHGHGYPDYTPVQVINVILLTPVWIIAGVLTGLGIAIWTDTKSGN